MTGLTPTEDLLMEVLVARTRLGHTLWTFTSNSASVKAARSLEAKGYLAMMHGVTPRTFRAELTDVGRKAYMTTGYVAPILGGPM